MANVHKNLIRVDSTHLEHVAEDLTEDVRGRDRDTSTHELLEQHEPEREQIRALRVLCMCFDGV